MTKKEVNQYLDKAINKMSTIIESENASVDMQLKAAETLSELIQTRHEINQ